MIWSESPSKVAAFERGLSVGNAIHRSELIHGHLASIGHDLEPVRYFRVPLENVDYDKTVTPYVTLSPFGTLVHRRKGVYGVKSFVGPRYTFNEEVTTLFEEAHALAEKTALTHGIFEKNGRLTAEETIAKALPKYQRSYWLEERIPYLGSLAYEVDQISSEREFGLGNREMLLEELAAAVTGLEAMVG